MTAPAPFSRPPGWYRSGSLHAAKRTVLPDATKGMADSAWMIVSRITAGLVLYTGLGWLVSRWIGHAGLLMAVGALVGLTLSTYMVVVSLHRDGTPSAGQRTDSGAGTSGSEGAVSASGMGGRR